MTTSLVTNPCPDIVLIGPTGAGKSTQGQLLAQHFEVPPISMDRLGGPYYTACGLSRTLWDQLEHERGFFGAYQYWWPCYPTIVEGLLADYPHGIIDLGAAHTHYQDEHLFRRVQAALAPYENVVLLLPSSDLDRSVHILRERSIQEQGWGWQFDEYDWIEHWVKDHCNFDLATLIVYTEGKTPDQTRDEILSRVNRR